MKLHRAIAATLVLALSAPALAQDAPQVAEESLALDPRFSPDRIKADVSFLADDLMKGREAGSPEYEIAALFAAQQFAALGLEPAGDDGTWYQRVPMRKIMRTDTPATLEITGPDGTTTLVHGEHALVSLSPTETELDVTAPMVFVGYGLEDERLGVDDYAGLDVKGKIVVALRGFPEDLPSEPAAYLVNRKTRIAEAHGAIGMIQIPTNVSRKLRPWERSIQYAHVPSMVWLEKDGTPNLAAPGIVAGASVDDEGANAILAGAPKTLAQLDAEGDVKGAKPKGFPLRTTARFQAQGRFEEQSSPNVVARLPGSDPALADEYVVMTAHLDHDGPRGRKPDEPADADVIFNGAMDNAAGSAVLFEAARVFAGEETAPKRSILFLLVTAEEKGLKGSQYFAKNPTVPAESLVGNVNLDMPMLLYPFTDLIVFGADHSTIAPVMAEAVAPMGVKLSPDPMPAETIFVRSDHFRFVEEGVPAVMLETGTANGGGAILGDFLKTHYHKVSDDLSNPFNWRAGARFAEVNYRVAKALANAPERPRWYEGDYFGDIMAPNAPKAKAP